MNSKILDCERALVLLAKRETTALAPDDARSLQAHLSSCEQCQQTEQLRALSDGLGDEMSWPRTPEAQHPFEVGTVVGRHVIIRHVGAGGMGTVYLAYDPELDRKVALKLLRSDIAGELDRTVAQRRLRQEGQALARLSHPNIVSVFEVLQHGPDVVLVMEYIEGTNLRAWARERRTVEETLQVFRCVVAGLVAAHEASIVHRDLKPENILVGNDGRVCITDFGLARRQGHDVATARRGPAGGQEQGSSAIGPWVGTLGYVAPEVLRGERATMASDQFSGCVVMYEALVGRRPFVGDAPEQLVELVAAPPSWPSIEVPGWLRALVTRGLAFRPEDRFPSMISLQAELLQDRSPRQRPALLAATAAGLLGVGLLVAWPAAGPPMCQGGETKVVGIWDDARRAQVRAAIFARGGPTAETIWRTTRRLVDGYVGAWIQTHADACAATRIRGEQSEQLLDLRMACLERRRVAVRELGDRLLSPSVNLGDKAVSAAASLPSLSLCSNTEALTTPLPLPADADRRHEIAAVRALLERSTSLVETGAPETGLEQAQQAAERADALAWRPLQAEAQYAVGQTAGTLDQIDLAQRALYRASALAVEAGHTEIFAKTATELVSVLGSGGLRTPEAHVWAALAKASIAALGGDPLLEASRLYVFGSLLYAESRYEEALDAERRALATRERALGPDHPLVARTIYNLALTQDRMGRDRLASTNFERARRLFAKVYGPSHWRVATTLNAMGNNQLVAGDFHAALALYDHARRLFLKTRSRESVTYLNTLENTASALMRLDRRDEALGYLRRAQTGLTDLLGAEHPRVSISLAHLGVLNLELGRLKQAEAFLVDARAKQVAVIGEDHPDLAYVLTGLGVLRDAQGRHKAAVELLSKARDLARVGRAYPYMSWWNEFSLAKAMWALGEDRAAARKTAADAKARLLPLAEGHRPFAEETDAWLQAHPL